MIKAITFQGYYNLLSCHSCTYKGDKRVANITFEDYWGCTDTDSFHNPRGVFVIFVHTEKGAALLEGVRDLELTETEFEHAAKGLAAACRRLRTVKQRVLGVAGKWCPKWVKKVGGRVLKR